jgi:hypothetical protein
VPRSVREYYNGYTRGKLAPFARRVTALREAPAAVRRGACEHHCSPSNVLRGVTQVDVVLAPTATGGVEVRAQHRMCTRKQEGHGFAPHKLVGVKRMLSHAAQSFGPEMRRALGGRPLHLYYSFYDNPRLATGASHPLLPHLVFASTPGTLDVAVPDWTFYDYPEAQHGMPDASWATISASLRRTSSHWRRKADALFWRGSPTSSFRKVVVDALAKQPRSSDLLLDVKFAGARQHVPWTVQCQNKLLLHMAGHGPSLGLKYKFACNSTVLVPDESELGEEFFYGALEAGVTHAAVAKRTDGKLYPADVLARAARLAADQGKARALAHGGAKFAASYLSPEAIDYFWLAFVREHASLSRNLDTVCGSSSPRWCNTGTAGKTLRRRRHSMGSTSAGRLSATAQSAPSPHMPPPPKVDHRAVAGAHRPAPAKADQPPPKVHGEFQPESQKHQRLGLGEFHSAAAAAAAAAITAPPAQTALLHRKPKHTPAPSRDAPDGLQPARYGQTHGRSSSSSSSSSSRSSGSSSRRSSSNEMPNGRHTVVTLAYSDWAFGCGVICCNCTAQRS